MLIYPEVFFSHKESLSFACWVPLSPPMSERQRKRDRGREVCRLRAFLYSCHAASLFRCFILRQTFSIGFPTIGSPYAFLSLCRVSVVVGYWLFCFSIAILSSMAFGHRKLHMGFGFLYLNFYNTFYNRKQRSVFYFFIILSAYKPGAGRGEPLPTCFPRFTYGETDARKKNGFYSRLWFTQSLY